MIFQLFSDAKKIKPKFFWEMKIFSNQLFIFEPSFYFSAQKVISRSKIFSSQLFIFGPKKDYSTQKLFSNQNIIW